MKSLSVFLEYGILGCIKNVKCQEKMAIWNKDTVDDFLWLPVIYASLLKPQSYLSSHLLFPISEFPLSTYNAYNVVLNHSLIYP